MMAGAETWRAQTPWGGSPIINGSEKPEGTIGFAYFKE
jgi:hypothetical protein